MASNMSSIGFPVKSKIEFTDLAVKTIKEGEKQDIKNAKFHKFEINEGIELLAISKNGEIACFKPYFKSTSKLRVKLSNKFLPGDCEFEKKILAYSIPDEIPILFDFAYFHKVPSQVDISKEYDLYLTAFAQNLECFKDEKEFSEKNKDFAPDYYIPSGTFYPNSKEPRNDPEAIFAGKVLDTKVILNSRTKKKIRWIKIETLIGKIDIVYDESELKNKPIKDGIINGQFWLIGDIDFPIENKKKSFFSFGK